MNNYKIFYIDKSNRIEAIMLCSFKRRINWVENGLGIVTWKYYFTRDMEAESLSEVYHKLKKLMFDKRKKVNHRPIGLGDIICVNDEFWIITTAGFQKIPEILTKKIEFS